MMSIVAFSMLSESELSVNVVEKSTENGLFHQRAYVSRNREKNTDCVYLCCGGICHNR